MRNLINRFRSKNKDKLEAINNMRSEAVLRQWIIEEEIRLKMRLRFNPLMAGDWIYINFHSKYRLAKIIMLPVLFDLTDLNRGIGFAVTPHGINIRILPSEIKNAFTRNASISRKVNIKETQEFFYKNYKEYQSEN